MNSLRTLFSHLSFDHYKNGHDGIRRLKDNGSTRGDAVEQVIQLVLAGVGLLIADVVRRSSFRTARAQYHQSMQATWNAYNQQALATSGNLLIAEWLLSWNKDPPPKSEPVRRKYLAFMAINAIIASYFGKMEGVMDSNYADPNIEQLLPPLVWKEEIFQLTQHCGYDRRFASHCAELRTYLEDSEGCDPKTAKKFASYSRPPDG
jgi:hypothetical protein